MTELIGLRPERIVPVDSTVGTCHELEIADQSSIMSLGPWTDILQSRSKRQKKKDMNQKSPRGRR